MACCAVLCGHLCVCMIQACLVYASVDQSACMSCPAHCLGVHPAASLTFFSGVCIPSPNACLVCTVHLSTPLLFSAVCTPISPLEVATSPLCTYCSLLWITRLKQPQVPAQTVHLSLSLTFFSNVRSSITILSSHTTLGTLSTCLPRSPFSATCRHLSPS